MTTSGIRVRFAPSPTGKLHLGNARTALFNWLLARATGGAFILRIEDTDLERNVEGAEAAILEDLSWLGLTWDEGPGVGGAHGPYRQSERETSHESAVNSMLDGGHAYRCFCSSDQLNADRAKQKSDGAVPRYVGRCRGISGEDGRLRVKAGESHVIRLKVPDDGVAFDDLVRGRVAFPGEQLGDPILIRSDGRPAYNFAVVADDIAMKVTHILRGEDHLSNTPIQILVYRALGHEPPAFAHLSIILGADGARLSKRDRAGSLANLREDGYLPAALINYLALLGWSHPQGEEVLSVEEVIRTFTVERVSGSAARFDLAKLRSLNTRHLRNLSGESILSAARNFLVKEGWVQPEPGSAEAGWWGRALACVSGQMETLQGAWEALAIFTGGDKAPFIEAEGDPASEISFIRSFEENLAGQDLAEPGVFRAAAKAAGKATGRKGRGIFHPLRVALTGHDQGPDLDRVIPLIEEGSKLALNSPISSCRNRLEARRVGLAERVQGNSGEAES